MTKPLQQYSVSNWELQSNYLFWEFGLTPNYWFYGSNTKEIKDRIFNKFSDKKIYEKECNTKWTGYRGEPYVYIEITKASAVRKYRSNLRQWAEGDPIATSFGLDRKEIRPLVIIINCKYSPKEVGASDKKHETSEYWKGFYWRYNVVDASTPRYSKLISLRECCSCETK